MKRKSPEPAARRGRPSAPSRNPSQLPSAETIQGLRSRMLQWYRQGRRDLPWRQNRDPYRVWLSEIMLQQTRVEVVVPYFERFVARFPTLQDLARAPVDEVLALWSGLGYYSRGRRLHEAAQVVLQRHGGVFPARPVDLRSLPGIGDYTAGAILSIAFAQREPAVDGNVKRVVSRWFALPGNPVSGEGARIVREHTEALVPADAPGDFNQSLMELGARVCTPRSPRCGQCPVASLCAAFKLGRPEDFPPAASKSKTEDWLHVAARIRDAGGRIFLVQRDAGETLLPGLWHLPSLFLPATEAASAVQKLTEHLNRTLGGPFRLGQAIQEARHQITYRKIRALAYSVESGPGPEALTGGVWSGDPGPDRLATSSLLAKLLATDAGPGKQGAKGRKTRPSGTQEGPSNLSLFPEPLAETSPATAREDSGRNDRTPEADASSRKPARRRGSRSP